MKAQIAKQSKAIQHILGRAFKIPGYAVGGMIHGPGTGTSDSITARVSAGEFVVNAAATARHHGFLAAINGGLPAYAAGGYVRPTYVRPAAASPAISTEQLFAAIKAIQPKGDTNIQVTEAYNAPATAMDVARRINMRTI